MRTKTSASLNGIDLSTLDGRIVLQGIDESEPNWNITMVSRAGKYGQRVTGTEKRYREITVRFAIAEHRDMASREAIIQRVRDWAAKGGWLTLTYRPMERLSVICVKMPAINGITKWAEAYAITFRSQGAPEWEAAVPDQASASGGSGNATLDVIPSAGGPLQVEAVNNSGSACSSISLSAAGQYMAFSGLGLADGETFRIRYDEQNMQHIEIVAEGGAVRSVLAKRTPASWDDIMISQGRKAISYSADASLSWKIYVHGRYAG
jgi:hypothetical protein